MNSDGDLKERLQRDMRKFSGLRYSYCLDCSYDFVDVHTHQHLPNCTLKSVSFYFFIAYVLALYVYVY